MMAFLMPAGFRLRVIYYKRSFRGVLEGFHHGVPFKGHLEF